MTNRNTTVGRVEDGIIEEGGRGIRANFNGGGAMIVYFIILKERRGKVVNEDANGISIVNEVIAKYRGGIIGNSNASQAF